MLITATDCNKRWLQEVIHFNVLAIVPRDSTVETFALAVNSAAMGMMFLRRLADDAGKGTLKISNR